MVMIAKEITEHGGFAGLRSNKVKVTRCFSEAFILEVNGFCAGIWTFTLFITVKFFKEYVVIVTEAILLMVQCHSSYLAFLPSL